MVKKYGFEERKRLVVIQVICDNCGKSCKNLFTDIKGIMCYSEEHSEEIRLIETVCYNCFEKKYSDRMHEVHKNQLKQRLSEN